VKETPYSIGYVELAYAMKNKVPYGWVKNRDGNFVKANLESVTAAAAGVAQAMPNDFRVSNTDAPGEKAYPISSFTWLLVPAQFSDKSKPLRGGGATFPHPMYARWFAEFHKLHPDIDIEYEARSDSMKSGS
jgi:ABC-type phosphate transport system substrate-binding protein